jgi:hypothetical protein
VAKNRLLGCACIFSACPFNHNLNGDTGKNNGIWGSPSVGVAYRPSLRLIILGKESNLKNLKKVFIHRLVEKGIEPCLIPGFVRVLTNSLSVNPHINLQQVNKRLRYLGWNDFELDYHTLSMAVACFEEEGFHNSRYILPTHSNSFISSQI